MLKTFHYNRKKDGSMLLDKDRIKYYLDNAVINLSGVYSLQIRGRLCDRYLQHIMTFLKESQIEKLNFDKFSLENDGAKVVAKGLKFTNITLLYVRHNQIKGENATYLADIVKQTSLTYLDISWNLLGDEGMKYLAEGLKNSNIITLFVGNNAIKIDGIKYLVDVLPYTKITRLDLNQNKYADGNYNEMGDEGVEYLSKQLEYSNISNLNLDWNQISSNGVKCLSEHLEKTCITFLSLNCNKLDENAEQYLMSILPKTQITGINAIPYFSSVDKFIKTTLQCHISSNNTRESKVKYVFLKLVAQNPQTHDLEFIIPEKTKDIDLTEYIYIMKEFNKNPMVKGYIFDLIRKNNCANYPLIIEKVNEFVALIGKKSIEFIEKIWPFLMKSSINNDFLNIVKEFENAELGEVVQYLLLHRVLFYVDEDAEILHPFIYMMLNKYGMPLYKEQIEPAKKDKIIAFFETHNEIEYAQEIIDLLKSKS